MEEAQRQPIFGMEEAQRQPIIIIAEEAIKDEVLPITPMVDNQRLSATNLARLKWLRIIIFTIFVLVGQATATLLGRLYFEKGGKSKWMATLVQPGGFPVQILFIFFYPKQKQSTEINDIAKKSASLPTLISLYLFLGILIAGYCMLFTIGFEYLPVSTYSMICASQIAFTALFSYFINAQKFTPFIINSLVLLTMSSTLLVFQSGQDGSSTKSSKGKYTLGFLCTLAGSCAYGFSLSVTQLAFKKILKSTSLKVVFYVNFYETMVATFFILIGLFASGEWKTLHEEMEEYELGKVSYVMVLVWTAILWQLFLLGMVGLIYEISSLFSNVIGTLGLTAIPICAVVVFHDKMNGVKVISLLLAIWGFTSYFYQNYLDNLKSKDGERVNDEIALMERA